MLVAPFVLLVLAFPGWLFAQKQMAVTIDDLPWVERDRDTLRARQGTVDFLRTLKDAAVPAIGFVNADKIEGHPDSAAWSAMLRLWLEAGFDLGNHTYSHRDLNSLPPADYRREVIDGERPWRNWMQELRPRSTLYFRHPFTHTGGSREKRTAFETFLAERGYRIAPFTVENADYMFDWVRWKVAAAGDPQLVKNVEAAYLAHHESMVDYFEKLSYSYFGRDVAQILLIHTNEINHRMLPAILASIRKRGYRFVTLDEALRDPAYSTEDRYYGTNGPSWVHRWSISLGKQLDARNEPDPPAWFLDLERSLRAESK
ncbi:MAG: polysaccharide deacetylase family protein [Bryobacteraceae bacterium]